MRENLCSYNNLNYNNKKHHILLLPHKLLAFKGELSSLVTLKRFYLKMSLNCGGELIFQHSNSKLQNHKSLIQILKLEHNTFGKS
jgi:hypothetical protein